jgi:type IV secretory pathway TrbD component
MLNHEEDKIVADLDREVSSKDGLAALIVCFGTNGWMVLMTAIAVAAAV